MSVQTVRRLLTLGLCSAALAIPSTARAQWPLDLLHEFSGTFAVRGPEAPLIAGRDGALYGTTYHGGASNRGTIFRMTRTGSTTILHLFAGGVGGEHPTAALLEAADGYFYGMSEATLAGDEQATAVFKMSPAGQFSIVHLFPFFVPVSPMIQATDGNLYGATRAVTGSTAAGEFSGGQISG